jgi:hypothetical protein
MNKYETSYLNNIGDKENFKNHMMTMYFLPIGYKSMLANLPANNETSDVSTSQVGGNLTNFTEYRASELNHVKPRPMAKTMVGFGNLSFNDTKQTKSKNIKLIL